MVVLRTRTRSPDNVSDVEPKKEKRKHKRQKKSESDSEEDISNLTQVEKWAKGRPFEIIANLPATIDTPNYNSILTHPLMVKDSGALYDSLWMSRRTWIYNFGNVFPLYWKKDFLEGNLEQEEEESVSNFSIKDKMQKMCDCTMIAGPHTFEIRLFILKDENIENIWQEEQDSKKKAKELKRLQDQEERRLRNEEKMRKKLLRQQEKERKKEAKLKAKQERMMLLQKKKEEMKRLKELKELQKKEKALKAAKIRKSKNDNKNSNDNKNNNNHDTHKIEKPKQLTASMRDSIMIANLNMLASKDPLLGSLMKKVADGEAMPDELEEFKQVIAMAKKMPAPPGWSPVRTFIDLQSMQDSQINKKETEVRIKRFQEKKDNPEIKGKLVETEEKGSPMKEKVSNVKDKNFEMKESSTDEKVKEIGIQDNHAEMKDKNSEVVKQDFKVIDNNTEIKEGKSDAKERNSEARLSNCEKKENICKTPEQVSLMKENYSDIRERGPSEKEQVVRGEDSRMKDSVLTIKEADSHTNKQTLESKMDTLNGKEVVSEEIAEELTSECSEGKIKQVDATIEENRSNIQKKDSQSTVNELNLVSLGANTTTKNLGQSIKVVGTSVSENKHSSISTALSVGINDNETLQVNEKDNVTCYSNEKILPSEQVKKESNENSIASTPTPDVISKEGKKRKDIVKDGSKLCDNEGNFDSKKKTTKRLRIKESTDIEEERLTAFQLKYLKGATLMLEFLEEKYIRYYIPKDSVIEYVEEKNEYIISWITIHNERDINRFSKKLNKPFDKEIYFVRGCPSPLYSTVTVIITDIPKRFSPIVLNSINNLEDVQRYMAQILATGTRLSGYNLWYQLDGYDDADLAEYYRVEANEYENRIRGKRAKRASSVNS